MNRRGFLALGSMAAVTGLAGCAVQKDLSSDEMIRNAVYHHGGQPRLTLFTMISNDTGSGAHTSLMINASQRVIFDPAGSFRNETIPVRGDVVYGVTPYVADFYTRFHARETYHVVVQELDVSAEVAEQALQAALTNGAVPQAYCARSTSTILSSLPGISQISVTFYPNKLMEQFGEIPGVRSRSLYEYDGDDKTKVLRDYVQEVEEA